MMVSCETWPASEKRGNHGALRDVDFQFLAQHFEPAAGNHQMDFSDVRVGFEQL